MSRREEFGRLVVFHAASLCFLGGAWLVAVIWQEPPLEAVMLFGGILLGCWFGSLMGQEVLGNLEGDMLYHVVSIVLASGCINIMGPASVLGALAGGENLYFYLWVTCIWVLCFASLVEANKDLDGGNLDWLFVLALVPIIGIVIASAMFLWTSYRAPKVQ